MNKSLRRIKIRMRDVLVTSDASDAAACINGGDGGVNKIYFIIENPKI